MKNYVIIYDTKHEVNQTFYVSADDPGSADAAFYNEIVVDLQVDDQIERKVILESEAME